MFYVPHYLWKIFEDRKVDKITNGLRGKRIDNISVDFISNCLFYFVILTDGLKKNFFHVFI